MQRSESHKKLHVVITTLLCALLTLSARAAAQSGDDAPLHTASRIELDVVKVVLAQERAWNSGDMVGYLKGYKDSPETVFIGRQVSRGFQQIQQDYEHNYPNRTAMGTLSFSELEAHSLGDNFAVCLGKYHVERSKKEGGAAEGLFSLVLERTDSGWKIILDHTT